MLQRFFIAAQWITIYSIILSKLFKCYFSTIFKRIVLILLALSITVRDFNKEEFTKALYCAQTCSYLTLQSAYHICECWIIFILLSYLNVFWKHITSTSIHSIIIIVIPLTLYILIGLTHAIFITYIILTKYVSISIDIIKIKIILHIISWIFNLVILKSCDFSFCYKLISLFIIYLYVR